MAANDAAVGTTSWLDSAIGSLFQNDAGDTGSPPSGELMPPLPAAGDSAVGSPLSALFGAWGGSSEAPPALPPSNGRNGGDSGSCGGESSSRGDFWAWAAAAAEGLSMDVGSSSSGGGALTSAFEGGAATDPTLEANAVVDVASLSVKDLKLLIQRSGLSAHACVERSDLVALAAAAQQRLRDAAILKTAAAANRAAAASNGTGATALAHGIAEMHGKHPVRSQLEF